MKKALVVVAHPDDETIWCGGTILSSPGVDWTIISLCRKHDKDRAPRFFNACREYGARCAMSDIDDDHPGRSLRSLAGMKKSILAMVDDVGPGRRYDDIFTHGKNGEYGHKRHKEVHESVRELVSEGKLSCKRILFFNYVRDKGGSFCVPNVRGSDIVNKLDKIVLKRKSIIISSVYNFKYGGFEAASSAGLESFWVSK